MYSIELITSFFLRRNTLNVAISLVLLTLFSSPAFSQTNHKKEAIFNLTQVTIGPVNRADFQSKEGRNGDLANDGSVKASARTMVGFFLNEEWSIAAGIGFDSYFNPNLNTVPIFLDIRYYGFTVDNNGYLKLTYGKVKGTKSNFIQGDMIELGFGAAFYEAYDFALVMGLNYNIKFLSFKEGVDWNISDENAYFDSIGVTVGILF